LLEHQEGHSLRLLLNRQAAYVGIVALCSAEEQSPMGPLVLRIETPAPEKLIDWLTLPQAPE
jgi:predicted RNA binding protein with dsRBD fold (UPF0201 family)